MVDAGFENQKELTKMQLDNQKEIAEMQNETQKEIAGIQSATSRQNTKDQVYAQNEMLAYQQEESTARVASIIENTNLFFFQAEDGIRDPLVTGVQTCALPISRRTPSAVKANAGNSGSMSGSAMTAAAARSGWRSAVSRSIAQSRSEERRVGKECRSQWSPDHKQINNIVTVTKSQP